MCVAWATAARLAATGSSVPASLAPAGRNMEAAPRRIVNGFPISEAMQARKLEDEACYGGLRDPFLVVKLAPRWQVVGKLLCAFVDRVLLGHIGVLAEVSALAGPHRADRRLAEVIGAAAKGVRPRAAAAFGANSVKLSTGGYCADPVRAITAKAADPDIDVATWMKGHTPLGVNATIQPRGISQERHQEPQPSPRRSSTASTSGKAGSTRTTHPSTTTRCGRAARSRG